jgi:CheY-like chemotaxis protein
MPGMDGMTLANAIKNEPALSQTRTILLTPYGQRLDQELMDESGVSQCLLKPVKQSRLLDTLMNSTQTTVLHATHVAPRADTASVRMHRPGPPLRVLLAEDNAVNQKVALRQLQKLGFAAHAVGNGAEVLQEFQRVTYDVILMDCQMPLMDGYEVTQRIREFEKENIQRTPVYIIAVTAHALEGDHERCLSAGMNDYLTKPLHITQLEAALNRAIRRRIPVEKLNVVLDPVCIAGLKELREPGPGRPADRIE